MSVLKNRFLLISSRKAINFDPGVEKIEIIRIKDSTSGNSNYWDFKDSYSEFYISLLSWLYQATPLRTLRFWGFLNSTTVHLHLAALVIVTEVVL